jgi:hypothetical protein
MLERRQARKCTLESRVAEVAKLVNDSSEEWLVWCDLNAESSALAAAIHGAVEVRGSDTAEHKEKSLLGFATGDFRVLVSKPKIAGWGMNYQHCRNMAFTGLSDSYEQFYQAVRRCWRFGQEREVRCHIVTDRTEGAVVENIRQKDARAKLMAEQMTKHMAYVSRGELREDVAFATKYTAQKTMATPSWLTA